MHIHMALTAIPCSLESRIESSINGMRRECQIKPSTCEPTRQPANLSTPRSRGQLAISIRTPSTQIDSKEPSDEGIFPCSLFPVPCSLFPVPCSLFPVPCSLFPFTLPPSIHKPPPAAARRAPAPCRQTAAQSPSSRWACYRKPECKERSPRQPQPPASYSADESD